MTQEEADAGTRRLAAEAKITESIFSALAAAGASRQVVAAAAAAALRTCADCAAGTHAVAKVAEELQPPQLAEGIIAAACRVHDRLDSCGGVLHHSLAAAIRGYRHRVGNALEKRLSRLARAADALRRTTTASIARLEKDLEEALAKEPEEPLPITRKEEVEVHDVGCQTEEVEVCTQRELTQLRQMAEQAAAFMQRTELKIAQNREAMRIFRSRAKRS